MQHPRRLLRRPANRQLVALAVYNVVDDGAVAGNQYVQVDIFTAVDLDGLVDYLHILPLALKLILARVIRVDFLDVEVLDIGADVGNTPGNVLVVADDDTGHPGKGEAHHVHFRGVQPHFIPDGGHLNAEVGVVCQQGHPGVGMFAADDPVVAADKGAAAKDETV